jgi:hypothetical protein
MKRGQKGFGTVEGLLILIIVLLVGFIGYYIYHTRNSANSNYNSAAKTDLSAQSSSAPSATKPDTATAESLVKDFYSAYIQATDEDLRVQSPQPTKDVVAKYGTPKFIDYFSQPRAFDPVYCAQNSPDLGVSITKSVANSSGDISVDVSQKYSGGGNIQSSVSVVGGKIDSISCPSLH